MKNKKGAGQFEMVISFVFFIGFVFFLFVFLSPSDTTSLSGAVIDGLHDSFEDSVSTNLSSLFLKAEYSPGPGDPDCFWVDLPENIFKYNIKNEKTYSTLLSGNVVVSEIKNDNDLNLNDDGNFFRIMISPEFNSGSLPACKEFQGYDLGNILEREVVSYKALSNMKVNYYSDYEGLRNQLKVPAVYDFAIVFDNMTELNMMPEGGIVGNGEVLARDYVFEVLKSDGELTNERINFRIW